MNNSRNKIYNHHFTKFIVEALHIRPAEFKEAVENQWCYESLLYEWITRLFKKGKTKEQALQIIYRARILLLL